MIGSIMEWGRDSQTTSSKQLRLILVTFIFLR